MQHPSYDAYWQARDISRHVTRVPAMLEVGGYYDAEDLAGPWRTFRGIEKLAPGSDNHIAIGPWSHGGWARGDGDALGTLRWNTKTGPWFRDSIELPFFMHYLAGGPDARTAEGARVPHRWRDSGIATTRGHQRTRMPNLYTSCPAESSAGGRRRRPRRQARAGVRRVRERSGESGAGRREAERRAACRATT